MIALPIRDHNPTDSIPWVTYALIFTNLGIFLIFWPAFEEIKAVRAYYQDWAMIPQIAFTEGYSHTLITHMFLHGGLIHLSTNMLMLWVFGNNLEAILGHVGYLLFYLLGGLAGGMLHYLSGPGSVVPVVGASGAISGLMGGYLLLFPKSRIDVLVAVIIFYIRIFTIPAWFVLGAWFALQLWNGSHALPGQPGVAYWAHAGGFVAGLVMALPLFLHLGGVRYWEKTNGYPPYRPIQFQTSDRPRNLARLK